MGRVTGVREFVLLQDDRVMSILTGLVVVVAMATLAQRSNTLTDFFFGEKEASIAPQNDAAALFAGGSQIVDVLANDENAKPSDANNIHILVSPSCGAAEATPQGVLYISNDRCVGPQLFAYCVKRGDECASASVTVNVAAAREDRNFVTAARQPAVQTPVRTPTQPVQQRRPAVTQPVPQPQPAQPQVVQLQPAQTQPLNQPTQTAAAPQPPVRQPVRQIIQDQTSETTQTAPQLRTPVPVVDDGGQAPLTQAGAAPAEETSFFERIFSAPSDEPAPQADPLGGSTPRVAALSNGTQWRPSQASDVSQILQPEPEIKIAAVTTESPLSTREQVQAERAQALPAAPSGEGVATPEPRPTASGEARCPVSMSSRPGQGGVSRIELQADCYASTTFVLQHAGLDFSGRFDQAGAVALELPIMEATDQIFARLDDGATIASSLLYDERAVEQTHRVAIAWKAPVNLDLHAFEYSAGFGADGHVWEQNPRGFRDVRRPGGGYHTSYPSVVIDGQSIEVYTFWANRRARPGFMRIAVDHASRGDIANGEFCGQGPLASPLYTVVRAERGIITTVSQSSFAPAACGQALDGSARYANGALADLRITE